LVLVAVGDFLALNLAMSDLVRKPSYSPTR
jgi:hypothetical protein